MTRRIVLGALMCAFAIFCVQSNSGCTSAQEQPDPGPLPAVKLELAFPELGFDKPLYFCHDGTGNGLVYVVEQEGRIYRFKNDPAADKKTLWLDIEERVPDRRHNEEGLLALAFHPKFAENGHFYVHYSMHSGGGKPRRGVTSRFTYDAEDDAVKMNSEKIIMEIKQPWGNHNGCMLEFGPDGYLYSSFGDGGAAGDPHDNGLDLSTLKGSILRIDVNKEENGKPYAIPEDNPFVDKEGARGEIWAYGLRNAWRFSFDSKTGHLWAGDVGQNKWEEIDLIVKGGNYGWNAREGSHKYNADKTKGMTDPVTEYGHDKGVSVTGGYVYRGEKQKALQGLYIYADYATGRLWGLDYDYENKKVRSEELLGHFPRATIGSFGVDANGELYACAHRPGLIYRVVVDKDEEEEDGF